MLQLHLVIGSASSAVVAAAVAVVPVVVVVVVVAVAVIVVIVAAVEAIVAGVDVITAGRCAFATTASSTPFTMFESSVFIHLSAVHCQ